MIRKPGILNLSSLVLALAISLTPAQATDESQSGSVAGCGRVFVRHGSRDRPHVAL
jgi:hypothetical protein